VVAPGASLSELPERERTIPSLALRRPQCLSDYLAPRLVGKALPAHGQEGARAAREAGPELGSEGYEVSKTVTPPRLRTLRLHQAGAEAAGSRTDPPKIFTRLAVEGAYCELLPVDVLRNP